ncbi:hypothetical protein BLOT_009153 [Blomia tropicalis]|nr:hypothetical protein BLOT_009153 [Blomia tropicalis]
MNNNFAQFCLIVIGLQMLFQIQVIMADCDLIYNLPTVCNKLKFSRNKKELFKISASDEPSQPEEQIETIDCEFDLSHFFSSDNENQNQHFLEKLHKYYANNKTILDKLLREQCWKINQFYLTTKEWLCIRFKKVCIEIYIALTNYSKIKVFEAAKKPTCPYDKAGQFDV